MHKLVEVFCDVDDFCAVFIKCYRRHEIGNERG